MRTTSSSPIMALGQGWSSPPSHEACGYLVSRMKYIETELKSGERDRGTQEQKVKPRMQRIAFARAAGKHPGFLSKEDGGDAV